MISVPTHLIKLHALVTTGAIIREQYLSIVVTSPTNVLFKIKELIYLDDWI